MILDKIGIFDYNKKSENFVKIQELIDLLISNFYNFSYNSVNDCHYQNIHCTTKQDILDESTMLLVLGGDGSLLRSARLASDRNLPILGVNFGKLGFLTETEITDFAYKLKKLESGEFSLETRPLITAYFQNENIIALNEIAIDKGASPRVIKLEVYINDLYFSTYTSDGLLVSTPTGSTAYNLSAGGPILQPNVKALILTPLNPHALAMRPFLIPDDAEIKIIARSEQNGMLLSGDGQESISLSKESEIIIKQHHNQASFIRFNGNNFYSLLRNKLGWGGFCDKTK